MNIQLYRPQNIILQNFIEYFYTLSRHANEEAITYLTFPNIYSMVSISQNATISSAGNKVTVQFSANNPMETGLAVRYKQPLLIEYIGAATEITIAFKPLGLNAFLSHPISHYAKHEIIEDVFIPFDDFLERMKAIMAIQKDEEKIAAMEAYWISKLTGVKHPFLYQALNDMLLPNHEEMSIAEIARKNKISQKTLIKHFERHIGKKPSDFRKIVRFRNALKQKTWESSEDNLTDITYISQYFDQSHMIKDFKVLTGYTPKKFFKKLSSSHDGKITWIFPGEG
ncbi:MAG: helix-turn-helix domain-containing protein [Bacteroidetes bacterium]|nr:helix-turn-helix domain-containing protein [Bacteroidota bacterium]